MTQPADTAKITVRHYQALGALALATVFLLQLQQSTALVFHALMLFVGALCLLVRLRFSPMFVFIAFASGQVYERNQTGFANLGNTQFLNLNDLLACIALLTYTIAQYRLNGLRFGVLIDARPGVNPARSEESLSAAELIGLAYPVPLCALAGQAALFVLSRQWGPNAMNPVWKQLFLLTWTLLLGMFLAAQAFRYWRRLQMTRAMARMMLQDILWHEIGGEQRRIERWTAWRKQNP